MSYRVLVKINIVLLGLVLILTIGYALYFRAPAEADFPMTLEVESGDSLGVIAEKAEEAGLVRSKLVFRNIVIISGGEHSIPAGQYFFFEPVSVLETARRMVFGEYGLEPIRVTIPEGWNIFRIAEYLSERFENIEERDVIMIAREGYLFPDTYFISPVATAEDVVGAMRENFEAKIESRRELIEASERSLEEIITMASIVEAEAHTVESKKKIADILWRRLDLGMPLQVDVTFSYVNGKNTYQLTREDLETDHPYNTYTNTGLPPTPIGNPGLESIEAAADPLENEYLYFLSNLSGEMFYAEDFEGHQFNRLHYLRK